MPQATTANAARSALRSRPRKKFRTFPAAKPALRVSRILVPLDFSGASRQALKWAVPLAEKFGARIVLAHVVVPEPITAPEMTLLHTELGPRKRAAVQQLDRTAADLIPAGLYERGVVKIGHAPTEILALGRRVDADLIVLSTRGQSGLKRFFIGSTAEQVVRHATCPVISVRRS